MNSYIRLRHEDLTEQALEEISATQGLFFTKILVLLDAPFATADSTDVVLKYSEALAQSANPIALLAPKLTSATEKKIQKHLTKVFREDLALKKESRGFNAGLVNALGAKNGRALWKELLLAKREGDPPEMLHGLLHWKARDMMTKGSKVWSPEEARALSVSLIELLSDSRGGDLPLFESLERFALSL